MSSSTGLGVKANSAAAIAVTTPMTMAEAAALSFPVVHVTADQAAAIRVGRRLSFTVPAEVTAIIAETGELLALYRPDDEKDGQSRAICVLV